MRNRLRGISCGVVVASVILLVMIGCDSLLPPRTCIDGDDIFILDWTGGDSDLWWTAFDEPLPAMDFTQFPVQGGGTLADVDNFIEMVHAQVEVIIDATGFEVTIITGEQKAYANNVHIAQILSPENTEKRLGIGYYDPCNCYHADFSLVYAQPMAGREASVRGWTNVFANICAHEIAHNLGFNHIDQDDAPEHVEYVELMLSPSSWEERQMEQRVIVEQDICPVGEMASTMMECLTN